MRRAPACAEEPIRGGPSGRGRAAGCEAHCARGSAFSCAAHPPVLVRGGTLGWLACAALRYQRDVCVIIT